MNQSSNGITLLMEVIEAAKQNAPDAAEWLEMSLGDYVYHDVDLEIALDLKSGKAGQEKIKTQWRRWQRDEALRAAFKYVEGVNQMQRIEKLRKEIAEFERTTWRKSLDLAEPPAEWSQRWKCFFRAMKSGCEIPGSVNRLYVIIFANTIYS